MENLENQSPDVFKASSKKISPKMAVLCSAIFVVLLLVGLYFFIFAKNSKEPVVEVSPITNPETSAQASDMKYLPPFPEIKTSSNITEKDLPEDLKFILVNSQNSSFKKIQYEDSTQGYVFTVEIPHTTAVNFHDMYTNIFFMSGASWGVLYNVENPNSDSVLEMVSEKYHARLEWKQKDSQKDNINIEIYERV